jgi:hypothetical protein
MKKILQLAKKFLITDEIENYSIAARYENDPTIKDKEPFYIVTSVGMDGEGARAQFTLDSDIDEIVVPTPIIVQEDGDSNTFTKAQENMFFSIVLSAIDYHTNEGIVFKDFGSAVIDIEMDQLCVSGAIINTKDEKAFLKKLKKEGIKYKKTENKIVLPMYYNMQIFKSAHMKNGFVMLFPPKEYLGAIPIRPIKKIKSKDQRFKAGRPRVIKLREIGMLMFDKVSVVKI